MSPYTHTQGDEPGDELVTPTPKPGESVEARLADIKERAKALTDFPTFYAEGQLVEDVEFLLALLTQQSQDRAEQEVLADAVVRLVNGGLNASVHMPSHERHAFRRWLSTFSDLAASPGKGAEGEADECVTCGWPNPTDPCKKCGATQP